MGRNVVTLDGDSLSLSDLVRIARDPSVRVESGPLAKGRVESAERVIATIVKRYEDASKDDKSKYLEYGVTTGFGEFKNRPVPEGEGKLRDVQRNLLLSHAVGVGENTNPDDLSNYFPAEVIRAALLIRLNTFLKGHSGVRLRLVSILEGMLNRGIVPLVPIRGSVGASGDLCPLSHLFATLVKEGRFYRVRSDEDLQKSNPTLLRVEGSGDDMLSVLREEKDLHDLEWKEMAPQPKEGLALNNGAAFSAALLALGVHDARVVVDTADVALSMTLEALGGCMRAFDPKVHDARPHPGQKKTAERVRKLLADSKLVQCSDEVQDPYSMRCAPQVHGASRDAIEYAATVAECEINSATDNPLIFDGEPWDKHYGRGRDQTTYSAGNFHGQPIALAADFLTIALAELANISERRTQTLMDENHNRLLPGNLIPWAGLNSGFMIAQYTAASLVSENKVLSHPASVDSIPTSANSEDHVSMSTHAARKMRTVLGNVQAVIAIELLVAAQALEWRVVTAVPSKRAVTAEEKQAVKEKWRPDSDEGLGRQATVFKDAVADEDEVAYKRKHDHIATELASGLRSTYSAIREHAPPMVEDRALDKDVRNVRKLIAIGALSGQTQ